MDFQLAGVLFVFEFCFIDQLVHSQIEVFFIQKYSVGFFVKGAVCFKPETLQFFGNKTNIDISTSFHFC